MEIAGMVESSEPKTVKTQNSFLSRSAAKTNICRIWGLDLDLDLLLVFHLLL